MKALLLADSSMIGRRSPIGALARALTHQTGQVASHPLAPGLTLQQGDRGYLPRLRRPLSPRSTSSARVERASIAAGVCLRQADPWDVACLSGPLERGVRRGKILTLQLCTLSKCAAALLCSRIPLQQGCPAFIAGWHARPGCHLFSYV